MTPDETSEEFQIDTNKKAQEEAERKDDPKKDTPYDSKKARERQESPPSDK